MGMKKSNLIKMFRKNPVLLILILTTILLIVIVYLVTEQLINRLQEPQIGIMNS